MGLKHMVRILMAFVTAAAVAALVLMVPGLTGCRRSLTEAAPAGLDDPGNAPDGGRAVTAEKHRVIIFRDIDPGNITHGDTDDAQSLVRLYGDALHNARIATISPLTSTALRDLGYEPAAEASPHTAAALVEAILANGQTDA